MDDVPLKTAILRKLALWPHGLTESDLAKLVRPAILWPGALEEMAMQGLIDLQVVGDESMARITPRGQEWLEHRNRQ